MRVLIYDTVPKIRYNKVFPEKSITVLAVIHNAPIVGVASNVKIKKFITNRVSIIRCIVVDRSLAANGIRDVSRKLGNKLISKIRDNPMDISQPRNPNNNISIPKPRLYIKYNVELFLFTAYTKAPSVVTETAMHGKKKSSEGGGSIRVSNMKPKCPITLEIKDLNFSLLVCILNKVNSLIYIRLDNIGKGIAI